MKLALQCALAAAVAAIAAGLESPVRAQAAAPGIVRGAAAAPATPPVAPAKDAKPGKPTTAEKRCTAAGRKLAKEQRYAQGVEERIATQERALKACGTKTQCARFESNLKAQQRLMQRHEKRLERFSAARDAACSRKG